MSLFNEDKIIIDACGGTGAWSDPYAEAGYDVRVVTWPEDDARIWPSPRSEEPRHPREFGDGVESLIGKVHGILMAPVCTVFSGSGALRKRSDADIVEGLSLVDACIRLAWVLKPTGFWVLENPVGKLRKWIGPPVMSFNPCGYGDPYTKRTLLWGDFNTNLKRTPVEPNQSCSQGSHLMKLGGKSDKTKELRSSTPPGFSRAFKEANL